MSKETGKDKKRAQIMLAHRTGAEDTFHRLHCALRSSMPGDLGQTQTGVVHERPHDPNDAKSRILLYAGLSSLNGYHHVNECKVS